MGSKISWMEKIIMKLILLLLLSFNVLAFDQTHFEWDKILKKYTVQEGNQVLFNYQELKKTPAEFEGYLRTLSNLKRVEFKSFSKKEKLAFWINVYNAFTVKLIIDNYPVKSIKDIGGWFGSPWKIKFLEIFNKKISLDTVEHGIIRKDFNEARIHFAVNCASFGCPSLLPEAFTGKGLELQLDKAAKNFLTNTAKNKYVESSKTIYMSKIFKWYGDDFKSQYGSYKKFASKYITFPTNAQVDWLDYDWNLNQIK